MYIKAYAKINISLDIVGKREDGYHLLEMIMQNIDLYDEIEVNQCESGIHLKCNKAYVPTDERNIAYKAAKLFMDIYNIKSGVEINIKKNIPVAAGLAGGSTDGAATLKAMRNLYKKDITDEELMEIGLKIGADIPYCIKGGTALCEGIGEVITELNSFKDKILVVVKPNFGLSTKEVYKDFDISKIYKHPSTKEIISAIENDDFIFVCENMKNVLENVSIKKKPIINKIKKDMIKMGAKGALMSGSGPTVFAFFDDMMKAQRCFETLKKEYEETFITRTINK